ncbi:hypothetical protein HQ40_03740 [Porphyromonas gulae]|uniref:DUF4280 domain-containing protein n=1 Tax=Porphyromonas gulae TaxID=111105 RepID=A0A0A2EGI1_9PORP|nr:PAAR-like protein [Porphyromonas gulae]KGN76600.1 hypothetical protein HQ40_03740 [Porphyromonas gulae]KGN95804.1 hypothetical protein HR15_00040 [Porphyromonas gulae]
MSKEAYVHEGVSLICTNGFKPAKLLVKDRGIRIAGGQLMATEEDKPTNFACKWAGVLAALIAAILIAAPFIVAVLAAFLIGMLAALSLGQLLCWVALQGGKWNMVHPRVKLKGQCALTENSKLTCALMSGDITIFYDEATASRALHNNWLRNSVEILGAAFMGRAFRIAFSTHGFINGMKVLISSVFRSLTLGYGIIEGGNIVSNLTTGEAWYEGVGDSLPFRSQKSILTIVEDDYQKPFTEPIMISQEAAHYAKGQIECNLREFEQFEQFERIRYKEAHPIHHYRRGRKSPHYGRQQQKMQKVHTAAKKHASKERHKLSQRYKRRVEERVKNNHRKLNWGLLAFFFCAEILNQHLSKSLNKSLQDADHPENKAKTKVATFSVDR